MIKCKQAMESSACGKVCCCLECEERESCKDVCTELSPDCEDAFSEETALATMQGQGCNALDNSRRFRLHGCKGGFLAESIFLSLIHI